MSMKIHAKIQNQSSVFFNTLIMFFSRKFLCQHIWIIAKEKTWRHSLGRWTSNLEWSKRFKGANVIEKWRGLIGNHLLPAYQDSFSLGELFFRSCSSADKSKMMSLTSIWLIYKFDCSKSYLLVVSLIDL